MSPRHSNHHRPLAPLVVIEGVDGSGKSTLARLLNESIPGSTLVRNLPSDTLTSKYLRRFPSSRAYLWALSRDRSRRIIPLQRAYSLVIQDRALLSEMTHLPNALRPRTRKLAARTIASTPPPDLIILLDPPPALCYTRITERDAAFPTEYNSTIEGLTRRSVLYRASLSRFACPSITLTSASLTETFNAALAALASLGVYPDPLSRPVQFLKEPL